MECNNCRTKPRIAGQAFTQYKCEICGKEKSHPNTAVPKLCKTCSEKDHKCERCKNPLPSMSETDIKKNIDEAVKVFRETLEGAYLKQKRPFYGIGISNLMDIFTGNIQVRKMSNGNIKISGQLPKQMFIENVRGVPPYLKLDDYQIYPSVVRMFNVSDDVFKGNKNE